VFYGGGNIEIMPCIKADKSRETKQNMIIFRKRGGAVRSITDQFVVIYKSFFFPHPEILFTFAVH
jgi:hypothetical protein